MKKRVLATALCALLLSGCAPVKQETWFSFTDSTGVQITLSKQPETVAVLFSSYADVWKIAGGDVAVTVGESVARGICEEGTPIVDDGAGKTIDLERLLSYEPDFVLCSATIEGQVTIADTLNELGIPCAKCSIDNFDDFYYWLDVCTSITGQKDKLKRYGDNQRTEIKTILSSKQTEGEYLFIRSASSRKSVKTISSSDHFASAMLSEFGLKNVADGYAFSDSLNIEYILTKDPDYLFYTVMGDETAGKTMLESILSEPMWSELSAVKNGRVYYLPKETFQYKPTDGWADAYAFLAETLQ